MSVEASSLGAVSSTDDRVQRAQLVCSHLTQKIRSVLIESLNWMQERSVLKGKVFIEIKFITEYETPVVEGDKAPITHQCLGQGIFFELEEKYRDVINSDPGFILPSDEIARIKEFWGVAGKTQVFMQAQLTQNDSHLEVYKTFDSHEVVLTG